MAYYLGVYNKLSNSKAEILDSQKPISFELWKSTRNYWFINNLEKYPLEPTYLLPPIAGEDTDIRSCCRKCTAMSGCVLYLYRPAQAKYQFDLTKSTSGKCYYLTGGSYKGDGPFDSTGTIVYGTPDAGDHDHQVDPANKIAPGFLGGSCNPSAQAINDPHFTGAHGTLFEFNEELNKPYYLATDKNVHINTVLKGYKSPSTFHASVGSDGKAIRSWIKELGLIWADAQGARHSLKLTAREGKEQARGTGFLSSAELDGAPLSIPTTSGASVGVSDMALTFLGTSSRGWYEVDLFSLKVGEIVELSFELRVAHPKLQSQTDAEVHFNIMFSTLVVSENVHGVLGQTYRNNPRQISKALKFSLLGRLLGAPVQADGPSGSGFLDGVVSDYVSSSVVAPDCKMSRFGK